MKNYMSLYRMNVKEWSVERVMFLFGGLLVTICSLLAWYTHPAFVWGVVFVGIMCILFAITGYCPGAIIAAKIMKK